MFCLTEILIATGVTAGVFGICDRQLNTKLKKGEAELDDQRRKNDSPRLNPQIPQRAKRKPFINTSQTLPAMLKRNFNLIAATSCLERGDLHYDHLPENKNKGCKQKLICPGK